MINAPDLFHLFDTDAVYLPYAIAAQNSGRNILHRTIPLVSEGNLGSKIAAKFTKQIIRDHPELITKRSSLDNGMNIMELAVNSLGCLEIIQVIYEYGMLLEVEDLNGKKGIGLKEVELQFANVQGQKLIPT